MVGGNSIGPGNEAERGQGGISFRKIKDAWVKIYCCFFKLSTLSRYIKHSSKKLNPQRFEVSEVRS